jgi:hypothetical protein
MIKLCSVENDVATIELRVDLSGSMLDAEERVLEAVNAAGVVLTSETLKRFDTDGSPILTGPVKWTTKGKVEKIYQTPYGEAPVARHVYQTSGGGKTYCPLDREARIVSSSTPRFAKMVSHKVANNPITVAQRDLNENHGRKVSREFVHQLSEAVGAIAQLKEESWEYETPKLERPVASVAVGIDGTCMFLSDDGWREAMAGTISLYDEDGERQHTIYIGGAPEYGKATFLRRMEHEIAHVKALYPKATWVGLADGAQCNWTFLAGHTQLQILDFWHVAEYLDTFAKAAYPADEAARRAWLDENRHDLKNNPDAARRILARMEEYAAGAIPEAAKEQIGGVLTYFRNNWPRMNYAHYLCKGLPIGSGVTEAACKTLVKHRLCASGMRWKEHGAGIVLSLRALVLTATRWEQFWSKIDRFGFSPA